MGCTVLVDAQRRAEAASCRDAGRGRGQSARLVPNDLQHRRGCHDKVSTRRSGVAERLCVNEPRAPASGSLCSAEASWSCLRLGPWELRVHSPEFGNHFCGGLGGRGAVQKSVEIADEMGRRGGGGDVGGLL